MRVTLQLFFCILLLVQTSVPDFATATPEPRDELVIPKIIAAASDTESSAVVAKHVDWSFSSAPTLVQPERRERTKLEAIVSPPPHAMILPGLLLSSQYSSSDI